MKKTVVIIAITALILYVLTSILLANKMHPIEKELEKRLPQWIGPAKKYTVKIKDTNFMDILTGNIKDLYLMAEDVAPPGSPVLENVKVHLYNVSFDMDKIKKIGKADFIITAGEEAINKYKDENLKEYPDLAVELKKDKILVSTNKKVMGFNLPVKVSGILEAEDSKKINFQCASITVSGIPLPSFVRDTLEKEINPLVDLTEIQIVTNILYIKILDRKLQVEGNAHLDAPIYFDK
ncbi:MAG: LmeA family phospholipid-binding protein [Armatimonadota bacterium]